MSRLDVAVVGAGAVGQVLAGYLAASGHAVVLVGRPGQAGVRGRVRLAAAGQPEREIGIRVEDALPTTSAFDAVFLAVRGDQLGPALDELRASGAHGRALVLCMPVWGPDPAHAVAGFDDTWLMFPGFGAKVLDSGAVDVLFARRPTEVGPMCGPVTTGLTRVAGALAAAGIPTRARPELGFRYTALCAVGGPFAVAIARSGFDLAQLVRNRALRRTAGRAARECIALAEARTGRRLGLGARILASIGSAWVGLISRLLARRAGRGRVAFILAHRRKVAGQDRALLAELLRWGSEQGRTAPALASLLAEETA
jgi:ketopantoate reductase